MRKFWKRYQIRGKKCHLYVFLILKISRTFYFLNLLFLNFDLDFLKSATFYSSTFICFHSVNVGLEERELVHVNRNKSVLMQQLQKDIAACKIIVHFNFIFQNKIMLQQQFVLFLYSAGERWQEITQRFSRTFNGRTSLKETHGTTCRKKTHGRNN